MKILLVGGTGYAGVITTRRLLSLGHRVTVFDNNPIAAYSLLDLYYNRNFSFIKGDIRDEDSITSAVKYMDLVINMAAIVGEHLCAKNPDLAREINYSAACNLARVAKTHSVKRFIFISTCSIYGITDTKKPATEDSPVLATSLYAETKIEAEKYILGLSSARFAPSVLRLATIFGISPSMRFDVLLNELVKEAFLTGKLTVYNPNSWRPFVHVADVADAVARTISAKKELVNSQVFNIGYKNYKKEAIARAIQKEIRGLKIHIIENKTNKRDYTVSFEKAKKRLGLQPRYSLEDGIKELLWVLRLGMFAERKKS